MNLFAIDAEARHQALSRLAMLCVRNNRDRYRM
jgi:hypothetical protein